MQAVATNCDRAAGYTLLEMLIVLVIMALGATIAIPLLQGPQDRLRLRTTSDAILYSLKTARAEAIAKGIKTSVVFDDQLRRLDAGFSSIKIPDSVTLRIITASMDGVGSSKSKILFFSDGSSTGGELLLSIPTASSSICVNWITGIAREGQSCLQPKRL